MHYTKVTINRDETASMLVHVGAWEVPILEAKHGRERITVGGLIEFENRKWPDDAESEMQRLNKLYGITGSGDNAPTFAERVYGTDSTGIRALEAAIASAVKAAPKSKAKAKPAADKPSLLGDAASA